MRQGFISGLRCSTRPDSLPPDRLAALREAGCGCVELGVQSFADAPLRESRRGYDGRTAREACAAVQAAGMRAGVQLMPGMPGSRPEHFLADVQLALELGAACLRFYPCLVLEGTELAGLWRAGRFRPWPLETVLDVLAEAFALTQRAGVPVIRMGLAPEAGLAGGVRWPGRSIRPWERGCRRFVCCGRWSAALPGPAPRGVWGRPSLWPSCCRAACRACTGGTRASWRRAGPRWA